MAIRIEFEWDPEKARINLRKHSVSFERASSVFRDPNLLSIPDEEHSENEERWVTIGFDTSGSVLVLIHTFVELNPRLIKVRIISARKAVKSEVKKYEKGI